MDDKLVFLIVISSVCVLAILSTLLYPYFVRRPRHIHNTVFDVPNFTNHVQLSSLNASTAPDSQEGH